MVVTFNKVEVTVKTVPLNWLATPWFTVVRALIVLVNSSLRWLVAVNLKMISVKAALIPPKDALKESAALP